ncbi:unnamed protein product, partial [Iphiclides podalirius]
MGGGLGCYGILEHRSLSPDRYKRRRLAACTKIYHPRTAMGTRSRYTNTIMAPPRGTNGGLRDAGIDTRASSELDAALVARANALLIDAHICRRIRVAYPGAVHVVL